MSSIEISEDVAKVVVVVASETVVPLVIATPAVQPAQSTRPGAVSSLSGSTAVSLPNNTLPAEIARLAPRFSRIQATSVSLQEWLGREDEVIGFSRANGMEIRI